jgi:hypothetical protein
MSCAETHSPERFALVHGILLWHSSFDRKRELEVSRDQIDTATTGGGRAHADGRRQIRSKWIRRVVLVIAGLESMAMLGIIVIVVSSGQLRSGEALSRSLGWAILEIYGLPYLILAMPALLLAALNRYLPVALVLSLLAVPAVWLVLRYA